jgi:hypothetical protein
VYGPVRTVVWQGSAGDRRPYADLTAHSDTIGLVAGPMRTRENGFRVRDHPGVDRFGQHSGVWTKPLARRTLRVRGFRGLGST